MAIMDEKTDRELVERALDGNQYAFAELVRRHQDAVFGLAVSMTRNREDAADMAQDAFIRAYQKLDRYNPDYEFKSWILRICANQTKNMFRSRMVRRRAEESHQVEAHIAEEETAPDFQRLEEALGKLPAKLGMPLRLKHMEGMSYEEVASVLGIGVSAAKMRTMRARQQLLEILES
jgi:RNA polymerase sigma-70 factor (ECF subfamily)